MGRATAIFEHIQTPGAAVEDTRKLHIRLKVQSHGAYDRVRPVCDLYKTSRARQSQAMLDDRTTSLRDREQSHEQNRLWGGLSRSSSIFKRLTLQSKILGSCTYALNDILTIFMYSRAR